MNTLTYSRLEGVHDGIDFDARYRVDGYRGIAWFLWGYKTEVKPCIFIGVDAYGDEIEEEDWSETEEIEDKSTVVATMVGDDRRFEFDRGDLSPLDDDEYCHECGQIGCCHGR